MVSEMKTLKVCKIWGVLFSAVGTVIKFCIHLDALWICFSVEDFVVMPNVSALK